MLVQYDIYLGTQFGCPNVAQLSESHMTQIWAPTLDAQLFSSYMTEIWAPDFVTQMILRCTVGHFI